MKYGSLFSGVEAAALAWLPLGWQCQWVAEIDAFASAVLAHHYPDVPNLGDVNGIDTDAIEPVDLIVFGSPCQSFSVAGKRLGLDDPRGNMALVGLRVVGRVRPRWVVWENVPGVLSSDEGRDFGSFLGLLGELGYGFAYRILDAQHFGVPQRRRRVFVVGHLGDWRPAAAVLFEPESLRGDTAPRREAGERIARPVASCIEGGSGYRNDADRADDLIAAGFNNTGQGWWNNAEVATGLRDMSAGSGSKEATLIAFSAKDHGADAGEIAPTLRAGTHHRSHANGGAMPAIARSLNAHPSRIDGESETFVTTLAFDPRQIHHPANHSNPKPGDPCHPLRGVANAEPAIVTPSLRADGFDASEDGTGRGTPLVTHALDSHSAGGATEDGTGRGVPLVPIQNATRGQDQSGLGIGGDSMFTLDSASQHAVSGGMTVRRLTPRECERLQGFPDDYTLVPYRGKPAADGPRYRAIGNSMAVPVVRWIGERIAAVSEATAAIGSGQ